MHRILILTNFIKLRNAYFKTYNNLISVMIKLTIMLTTISNWLLGTIDDLNKLNMILMKIFLQ